MKKSEDVILSLISNALNGDSSMDYSDIDWYTVYELSNRHSISSFVLYSIEYLKIDIPEEILKLFYETRDLDIAKDFAQVSESEQVLDEFEKNGVECMPLKGYYMQHYYPETYLRTKCDIDILIKQGSIDKAVEVMERLGYKYKKESEHDLVFERPPFVTFELHKLLLNRTASEKLYQYYTSVWDKAIKDDEKDHIYRMTDEDFYIYMIVHLAKHYIKGGTGIRTILDVYMFLLKHEGSIDDQYISAELEKIDLQGFSERIKRLAKYWFGNGVCEKDIEDMSDFILSSSTYGNYKLYSAAKAVKYNIGNGKKAQVRLFIELIFPKYKNMIYIYPSIKGKPILLPWYWIWRAIDKIILKKKQIKSVTPNAKDKDIEYVKKHFEEIELTFD